jgi:D-alanine-D-alanine ligase
MKKKKLRIGILFGGRSGEHEVSLLSAASILKAIDRAKYDVTPIGITKDGRWVTSDGAQALLSGNTAPEKPLLAGNPANTATAAVIRHGETVIIPPVPADSLQPLEISAAAAVAAAQPALALDAVFPVLHGTFGEDGTIQGLFELADIAYVGSGVLGSAVGMDKIAMKQIFGAVGIPQTPYLPMLRSDWLSNPKKATKKIEAALKYPIFVKPANAGSSVGISKVHDRAELPAAMELAARYDRKLILEEGVGGPGAKPRELEVAVLGNDNPEASVVGEIVPGAEFYDYEAKYVSDTSVPIIPAKLTKAEAKQIREMAVAAYKACDCAGLSRVDFLMEPARPAKKSKSAKKTSKKPKIYLNEINTLPGFTSISMYPKLWAATGLPYKKLIDRLIELALERHAEKKQTSFTRT